MRCGGLLEPSKNKQGERREPRCYDKKPLPEFRCVFCHAVLRSGNKGYACSLCSASKLLAIEQYFFPIVVKSLEVSKMEDRGDGWLFSGSVRLERRKKKEYSDLKIPKKRWCD